MKSFFKSFAEGWQRGSVTIMTLVLLVVFVVITSASMQYVARQTNQVALKSQEEQAFDMGDAGISYAQWLLSKNGAGKSAEQVLALANPIYPEQQICADGDCTDATDLVGSFKLAFTYDATTKEIRVLSVGADKDRPNDCQRVLATLQPFADGGYHVTGWDHLPERSCALTTADFPTESACNNGKDDDGDGYPDKAGGDPGCSSVNDPSERSGDQCDNGEDDDIDGSIDTADSDCTWPGDTTEGPLTECNNNQDDDGDDTYDCRDTNGDNICEPGGDPGCEFPTDSSERGRHVCDDTIDNDDDDAADEPADKGCNGPSDASEIREQVPCTTRPIAFGETKTGGFDDADCWFVDITGETLIYAEEWTFDGTQDSQIQIEMKNPNDTFASRIQLKDANGVLVPDSDTNFCQEPSLPDDDLNACLPTNKNLDPPWYFTLPATGQYTIVATNSEPEEEGPYTISLTKAPAGPPNDHFVNAETFTDTNYTSPNQHDNEYATVQQYAGEPLSNGCSSTMTHTVWYKFTNTSNQSVTLQTDINGLSGFTPIVVAYSGSTLATLQSDGCGSDGEVTTSSISPGQSRYFQVGSSAGYGGDIVFKVRPDNSNNGNNGNNGNNNNGNNGGGGNNSPSPSASPSPPPPSTPWWCVYWPWLWGC